MTEPTFQTLGRYTIRAEIGRGGFATVYQALDASLNREVALKVLHPQMSADRTFVERFRKEARTLAGLRHPHIITVYEVSEVEGRLFIAMELAHGPSLAQAIADRKRFPWADTLALVRPVSEALDYAHGQGVVHRDLKPANILLDAERGPLLTDFGFARLLGDTSASMSVSGGILGTPAYIAPEVWELDTATPAADIYALGCIVYEMLTGDVLFVGKTPMQSMRAHDRGPQFPADWPADVPPGFSAALQVALARKPENRYPKPTTFWHALNDLEANAQVAREQAERQVVADQWKAEVTEAMAAGEWSAAKMAVGRWLSITPDDAQALAARQEIERQIDQRAKQKDEAEHAAQAAIALEAARQAEEIRARQEADRKAQDEQERQRQAELAAQAAAAEKAKQETDERERQRQAREAAKLAEEEARRKELAAAKQPIVVKSTQSTQTETSSTKAKSNRMWLYAAGGIIAVLAIGVVLASIKPPPLIPTPTQPPAAQPPAAQPTEAQPTEAPADIPPDTTNFLDRALAGEFKGAQVTASGAFLGDDEQKFKDTMKEFEDQTGITIQYEATQNFVAAITAAFEAGDAPDIIDFPRSALLVPFVKEGKIIDLSNYLNVDAIKANYNPFWIDQSMMDGPDGQIMAGVWERANPRDLVFYPKKAWDAAGYAIPTTFEDLKAMMDHMVANGITPWCIGIESGAATGWVATDWIEKIMLRTTTPENYDAWTTGALKFASPEVKNAVQIMSDIWLDPKYVHGGPEHIVNTNFADSVLPMFDSDGPKCFLHMNGTFTPSFFPQGLTADVDYGVFYFPPIDPQYGSPLEVTGDIWAATSDRPEVMAVMEYFTKGEHLKVWMQEGGAFAPQKDADLDWYNTDVDRTIGHALLEADPLRFDASDNMPAAVGTDSFWKEMTNYVAGNEDLDTALQNIDAALSQ
jgi:alpha-glucoside transport system substrate-binding protein